jgi:hypothetical protein
MLLVMGTNAGDEQAAARAVRNAALRTAEAGGVRLFHTSRRGSPMGEEFGRTEGIGDLRKRIARVSVHHLTPEFEREMQSELGDAQTEDPEEDEMRLAAASFVKMFSSTLENVHVGGATYTRLADRGWANFKQAERDAPRSPDDPLWLLDALIGVRDATEVGREEVRGVPTTRYRLGIDLAAADEQLPRGITAPGPRLYRSLRALPAEVWIDDEGRIRRMSYEHGERRDYWQTTELWDFGLDVEIQVPAEDEMIVPSPAVEPDESPGT